MDRRDDVFRWIETTARLINHDQTVTYRDLVDMALKIGSSSQAKKTKKEALSRVKLSEPLFTTLVLDKYGCQNPRLTHLLNSIVSLIREMQHPDIEPDYKKLGEILDEAMTEIL